MIKNVHNHRKSSHAKRKMKMDKIKRIVFYIILVLLVILISVYGAIKFGNSSGGGGGVGQSNKVGIYITV